MVMTPVPPTPATTMPQTPPGATRSGITGSGSAPSSNGDAALSLAFSCSWPPSTVTKLGQKPLTQE